MEANPKKAAVALHNERFNRVMQWPGLRGEPKLAWFTLYHHAAGCRLMTIRVHPATIAAAQGTDARSGKRALESLEKAGLIQIADRKVVWTIFLNDPLEVAIGRFRHESYGQGELFEVDIEEATTDEATISLADHRELDRAVESPSTSPSRSGSSAQNFPAGGSAWRPAADVAQQPPADVAQQPPRALHLEQSADIKTLHLRNLTSSGEGSRKGGKAFGGCGATTAGPAAAVDEPRAIASVLGSLGSLVGDLERPELRAGNIQRLTRWILDSADDPDLHPIEAQRWATLIADGRWTASDCAAVIECTRRRWRRTIEGRLGPKEKPVANRTQYLIGSAKRSQALNDRRLK